MVRSLATLLAAALLWTGGRWGAANLYHHVISDDLHGTFGVSEVSLLDFPDIANDRWTTSARRRRSARHDWPEFEPPDEPLPLPDELESPEADQEASLATLRRYSPRRGDFAVCCPAGEELTSPRAGTRRDGSLGILYSDEKFQQMFFERSCRLRADAEDSTVPAERRARRRYRCVQQYSHSYAVYNVNGTKVLDYIRIRSGCKCEMKSRPRRKRKRP